MQTEASTLPVVQLHEQKKSDGCRKFKSNSKNSTLESKKLSPCRNTLFVSNKKCLNPLLGGPYKNSIKQQPPDEPRSSNRSFLGQRVMSAKILRFKQLQNQLTDAHYHLNELANENRLLKALQKRQDSALRRYEGTNAELPRIINSHHEELRVFQTKYKRLKELHKSTCNLLKERENELYAVNVQNKHLLQLSKDRNLGEREKLQLQISDMSHEMQQQQETIQLLHRKLALETKSLKHQLHVEISKHKETQKSLQETIQKLKTLECLLDNREKRLYYNGQLPIYNKEKNLGSHSFTNLSDVSVSNAVQTSSRKKRSENSTPKDNLPSLDVLESNDDEQVTKTSNVNQGDQLKSETMASLNQIRKFRLQKSPQMRKHAYSMNDLRFRFKDPEIEAFDNGKIPMYRDALVNPRSIPRRSSFNDEKIESGRLRKLFNRMKSQASQNLQQEVELESDYSSDESENNKVSKNNMKYYSADSAQNSRELYKRLINEADDTSDTLDNLMRNVGTHYSDNEEEKEEKEKKLSRRLMKDLSFQKQKYKSKSGVLQCKNKPFDDSDSEVDSEEKLDADQDYSSGEYKTNLSKYSKKQFLTSCNNTTHLHQNVSEMEELTETKNAELKTNSNNLNNIHPTNEEILVEASEKIWTEEELLQNNDVDDSIIDIIKEEYKTEKMEKHTENKTIHTDMLHDNIYSDTCKQNNEYEEVKNLPSSERKSQNSLHQTQEEYKMKKASSMGEEYLQSVNSKTMFNRDKATSSHIEDNDYTMHNLIKEYHKLQMEDTPDISHNESHEEETLKKNNFDIETNNRLNTSSQAEDVKTLFNNVHVSHQTEQASDVGNEATNLKQTNAKKKVVSYNKEKLLATMKAIDDNENIEFLNQGYKNYNVVSRMQITQNLYRGLPTHSKPKRDVIKDIFEDNHIENKMRGTCSKSH